VGRRHSLPIVPFAASPHCLCHVFRGQVCALGGGQGVAIGTVGGLILTTRQVPMVPSSILMIVVVKTMGYSRKGEDVK
jgi:hypothetical protein